MNAPPLFVSFSGPDAYLQALTPQLREQFGGEIRQLAERGLPPVVSGRCLALLFGFSSEFVGAMARRPGKYYREFSIRKGRRGKRLIQAPRVALKVIQKWFGHHLALAYRPPDCVYGFVAERSAPQAAKIHCGAAWVLSSDIKDFFPTTAKAAVVAALIDLGYSPHGAELAASLCCYRERLAQGSPASPVLSNLVFKAADAEIEALAREVGVRYTRYADDVVLSGGAEAPPPELAARVNSIIERYGWQIANKKQQLDLLPHRLKVHGLLVHGAAPRLTKGYRNRLRAYRHLLAAGKVKDDDVAKFKGHLAYARSVEGLAQ